MQRGLAGVTLAGLTATVALLVGLGVLSARPPVYEVRLVGANVGIGRDARDVAAALKDAFERDRLETVSLEAGNQRWTFTRAELGMTLPAEPLQDAAALAVDQASRWMRLPWQPVTVQLDLKPGWDAERLEAALLPVKQVLARDPVPARFTIRNQQPVIIPETPGAAVDTRALLAALQSNPHADRLDVPVAVRMPEVTLQSLQAMRVKKLIAEWSTHYDPTIPRGENVARAARAFNGRILKPGEILSYNATVGPVDAANGWKEAYVIEDGQLVPGIGGGVCQVATTFYGAALRANLEILERHQHDLAVTYIEPSQDAAIAQGYQDLKLKNTTVGYVYIETEAEGGTVTFRLYGDAPDGQQVKIESRVLSTTPYPTRTVRGPNLAPGERAVQVHGNNGFTSEAYRLLYQNGELVKKEKLSQDSYLPTTEIVAVGSQ